MNPHPTRWTIGIAQTSEGLKATLTPETKTIPDDQQNLARIRTPKTAPQIAAALARKFNTNTTKVTLIEPTETAEICRTRCTFTPIQIQGNPDHIKARWTEIADILDSSHKLAPEWHQTWLDTPPNLETHNSSGQDWAGQLALTRTGPQLTHMHTTRWASLIEGQGTTLPIPPTIAREPDTLIINWITVQLSSRDSFFAPAPAPHHAAHNVQLWQITCCLPGNLPPRHAAIKHLARLTDTITNADKLGPHTLAHTLEKL